MRMRFHRAAEQEYENAASFYAKRSQRAAREFVAALKQTYERILAEPTRWRTIEGDVRKCVARGNVPYAVFYVVEEQSIYLLAVAHHRRRPGYWRERLNDENAP